MPDTAHTFKAVEENCGKYLGYSAVFKGYKEGKVPIEVLRKYAFDAVSTDLPDNPLKGSDGFNAANSQNPDELLDYVGGAAYLYDYTLDTAFEKGLAAIVTNTPADVKKGLLKLLPHFNPKEKEKVSASYEKAAEIHRNYHVFLTNKQTLGNKNASEEERHAAKDKIAQVINSTYDTVYSKDGVIIPGYEKLVEALKSWTIRSMLKLSQNMEEVEGFLEKSFTDALNGNIDGYLTHAMGRKVVRKLYELHFQEKAQEKHDEAQKEAQKEFEND